MTATVYWISTTVVVDWTLTTPAGDPVTDATVNLVITKPDGSDTAAIPATHIADGLYRALYDPADAGLHAFDITASGTGNDTVKGNFYVKPDPLVGPPPTVDPTTEIGQVRLLATDIDEDALLLTDAQITALLTLEDGVRRAAAAALETIATSEVLVSKVLRTQDLATDGAKVSTELRARAADLRNQADRADDAIASGFDIADFDVTYGAFTV